jgi:hypothetical protein
MAKLGKTALFYRKNRKSYLKKLAKANKHPVWGEQTPKRKAKRKKDYEARKEAKKNGKDVSKKHWDIKTQSWKNPSDNTGQAEASRVVGSKRNKNNFGKSIKQLCS